MKKVFSIIMPIYNSEKYLEYAIESILRQTFPYFELILIDDGSTDHSSLICDSYAEKDSRIRVVHKQNGGICETRNLGLSLASGQYIGFMDNDDIVEKEMLDECYHLIEQYQADWIKFGKREILLINNKEISRRETDFTFSIFENEELKSNLLNMRSKGIMTFVWDSFIKREVLYKSGIRFDENFCLGNEDIDFCEQLAFFCKKLIVTDKIYYNHYTRMGISASTKYSKEKIESYIYLLSKCNDRYISGNLITEETQQFYLNIVTKQIVINICQRLTDAGKELRLLQKCKILDNCKNRKEFNIYLSLKKSEQNKETFKLKLYRTLFLSERFILLLLLDKYSRKLVYFYRRLKKSKIKKGENGE